MGEKAQVSKTPIHHYSHHELKYPISPTCASMWSGLTRYERAYMYKKYMDFLFGASNHSHRFVKVEGTHSSCGIFRDIAKMILSRGEGNREAMLEMKLLFDD